MIKTKNYIKWAKNKHCLGTEAVAKIANLASIGFGSATLIFRHGGAVITYRIGELLGKDLGQPDLIDADHGVGGDDGAGGMIHPLPHHVHAEQALLTLNQLLQAPAGLIVTT